MLKAKHVFLGLALLELAISFSNVRPNVLSCLGLPLGAALFMLFLIFHVMEKASALLDAQNRAAVRSRQTPRPPPASTPRKNTNPAQYPARMR
jgi:hypothetical protein